MTIAELNELYLNIFKDKKLVFGDGDNNAKVMLIGEAPGREEEEQGRPFVGKAGKNLTEFLSIIGLKRNDLYITNVVKFRPVKISEKGTISNRTPTKKEIIEYKSFLLKEIDIINPKIIITLGNTPLKALLGDNVSIGNVHGRVTKFNDYNLFALYHPASIIYNPPLKSIYAEDLIKLKNFLQQDGCSCNFYNDKTELRRKMKILRNDFVVSNEVESAFQKNLLDFLKPFENIFIYNSFGSEADTSLIIKKCLDLNKNIYLPKIIGKNMYITKIDSGTKYIIGSFGIKEPLNDVVAADNLQVCICPGLAFDSSGGRLGFGKGYYDKFLSGRQIIKVGFCYDFQVLKNVPTDQNDILMDYIISEKRRINILK